MLLIEKIMLFINFLPCNNTQMVTIDENSDFYLGTRKIELRIKNNYVILLFYLVTNI